MLQAAFSEAESFRRQEALIREEEEREAECDARAALKAALDRERKARKRERRKVPASTRMQNSRTACTFALATRTPLVVDASV